MKLEIDDVTRMSLDETDIVGKDIVFDDDALISLCQIFNKQEKWKRLAGTLKFDSHKIRCWESASNPTKMILREIENEKLSTSHIISIFQQIREPDAVNEIDAMIARQSEKDDF